MGASQCFVGAYTALMLYRQPDTWAPKSEAGGKSGKAKAAFAAALQSSFREAHAARVRLDDLCPAAFDHIWRCSVEKTEQAISIDGRVQMRGT